MGAIVFTDTSPCGFSRDRSRYGWTEKALFKLPHAYQTALARVAYAVFVGRPFVGSIPLRLRPGRALSLLLTKLPVGLADGSVFALLCLLLTSSRRYTVCALIIGLSAASSKRRHFATSEQTPPYCPTFHD